MRSDFASLALIVLTCGSLMAAAPSATFAANQDRILSGECFEADGVLFGVGVARPRNDSTASRQAAREKALLAAKVNLIVRKAISGIRWPDDVSEDRRREIIEEIAPFVSAKAVVKGLETVYLNVEADGRTMVVVALPSGSATGIRTITYVDTMKFYGECKRRLQAKNQNLQTVQPQNDPVKDAIIDKADQMLFVLPKDVRAIENETIGF